MLFEQSEFILFSFTNEVLDVIHNTCEFEIVSSYEWDLIKKYGHKKIVLKPGASDVEETASGSEVAMAGKGFNEEVEKNYRTGNKNLDYDGVDKMEKIVVSQPEIEKFLNEGGLTPEGGVR